MSLSYYLKKLHWSAPPKVDASASLPPGHVASSLGLGLGGFSSAVHALGMLWHSYAGSSLKLLVLGSVIETGRRLFRWLIERFSIEYCTTMHFTAGDPAYERIVLLLTEENVWRRSREFMVSASNSHRKWAVRAAADTSAKASAEYVPTYQRPQLFRWRGYWVEIQRRGNVVAVQSPTGPHAGQGTSISVTIYTLDMNVLSDFVEDAHRRYIQINRPHVVVHLTDTQFGPNNTWTVVKHKTKRPLDSVILPDGVVDSLVQDAQEFIATESWYIEAGIPHRRGYLLYGPPGTGKTSTLYALAGALNLEIYMLSLASRFVDDAYLQRAASAIPKHGIFVIEDIDCAFPSRDEDEDEDEVLAVRINSQGVPRQIRQVRTAVTLSGLLNVIDGVGSEEGKLFLATTNHIERLDAALLRPGRIDRRVQYQLATRTQAEALFARFFPAARFPELAGGTGGEPSHVAHAGANSHMHINGFAHAHGHPALESTAPDAEADAAPTLSALAALFAARVPPGEFSTAELQGFLQGYKTRPREAIRAANAWVEAERAERKERERLKMERRAKARERRAAALAQQAQGLPAPGQVLRFPALAPAQTAPLTFVNGSVKSAPTPVPAPHGNGVTASEKAEGKDGSEKAE